MEQLKPADLILVRGTGLISHAIEDVEHSPYSHVAIYVKDGSSVSLSQTQYNQLLSDIDAFADPLTSKQHDYITQVNACTTVAEVNVITVAF